MRNYRLRSEYGIGLDDYNVMFLAQAGQCAICEKHQSELKNPLVVDHCHETGIVRGLLCRNCNSTIGFAHDNILVLKEAVEYLTNA